MDYLGLSLLRYAEFQDKMETHQNSLILSLIKQHEGEGLKLTEKYDVSC